MTLKTHVATSTILFAGLYYFTSSLQMAAAALLSGIFIDLDHVLDFFLHSGEKFSVKNFFSFYSEGRWKRLILLFHSFELYTLLAVYVYFNPDPVLKGLLFGTGLHLLLDQVGNMRGFGIHPLFYFISFRALKGFRQEGLRINE